MKRRKIVMYILLLIGTKGYAKLNSFILENDNTRVDHLVPNKNFFYSNRPPKSQRLFISNAVEAEIRRVKGLLTNTKLVWMFENCFPNTLDSTVLFRMLNGMCYTFVYTGYIHAMWLRDSGAQVWPYVQLANDAPKLKEMIEGVIRRQFLCINIDPYANAYNDGPTGGNRLSLLSPTFSLSILESDR